MEQVESKGQQRVRRLNEIAEGIRAAINRSSGETESGTPDFVLAEFLVGCLKAYDTALVTREAWLGKLSADMKPFFVPQGR